MKKILCKNCNDTIIKNEDDIWVSVEKDKKTATRIIDVFCSIECMADWFGQSMNYDELKELYPELFRK